MSYIRYIHISTVPRTPGIYHFTWTVIKAQQLDAVTHDSVLRNAAGSILFVSFFVRTPHLKSSQIKAQFICESAQIMFPLNALPVDLYHIYIYIYIRSNNYK